MIMHKEDLTCSYFSIQQLRDKIEEIISRVPSESKDHAVISFNAGSDFDSPWCSVEVDY